MKRMIKKYLLPSLFWCLVWFGIIGGYVVINDKAALQHGYSCLGIEDMIMLALIMFMIISHIIKKLKRKKG